MSFRMLATYNVLPNTQAMLLNKAELVSFFGAKNASIAAKQTLQNNINN